MKFAVTMYRDEDGYYVVDVPSVPSCMSQGDSPDEAIENVKEALQLCLEVRKDDGLPLTVPVEANLIRVPMESYVIDLPISA